MNDDLKVVDNSIVPIYEHKRGERLINARELHKALGNKRKFSDWIKQRIDQYGFVENIEFWIFSQICEKIGRGRPTNEYYITIDMAKELCMVENNSTGKQLRRYFIEVEKRYRSIVESPQNIFQVLHKALYQIEENENKLKKLENETSKNTNEIEDIKRKIDVVIKKNYCLASDIAEQLHIYSENNLPHSSLVGAIAREIGIKIEYKHYYEDEKIAIVPDISKGNKYYQIYYKPKGVKEIIEWFNKNKNELEYKVIYERNTKNGRRGEIKERGYKIDNVCYKCKIEN